jgi:phage FluMu protein Com
MDSIEVCCPTCSDVYQVTSKEEIAYFEKDVIKQLKEAQ